MKKFLAMLMLLAMCFSCAAMAETTDEDLAAAKTYLFMMYKDLPETTMSDYEVVGVINIGGIEFPITWTADSDTIKIVPQDNKMVTIDVDEKNPEEVTYTLTATLSNAAGETVSVSFAHKVPAAMILEGMSYEEIAELMNCPIGTVRSRIFRAREAISARVRPMLESQSGKRW